MSQGIGIIHTGRNPICGFNACGMGTMHAEVGRAAAHWVRHVAGQFPPASHWVRHAQCESRLAAHRPV